MSSMGGVELGVRADLTALGINEPKTTLECLAIKLAQLLDEMQGANDQKNASPATLSRELRQTMREIEEYASDPEKDKVRAAMDQSR